ncbi:unnamed protein product, partial [marine sediment metagenome]
MVLARVVQPLVGVPHRFEWAELGQVERHLAELVP